MSRSRLYPPSVDSGFPTLPATPTGWTRTTFDKILEVVERPVKLDPARVYKTLTAKRNRGGIVLRDEILGKDILTKTQFEAKAGDFVISRRQIIHGACAVVPPDLDGAVVSNEYSTLRTRCGLLMEFLEQYSHTPYFQRTCFHSSHGVDVEKMIFKIDEWLAREASIPPLGEQRKIAVILTAVDEAIEATQAVIDQLQVVKKAMMAELLTRGLPGRHTRFQSTKIGSIPQTWSAAPLGKCLDGIDAGWSPKCEPEPAGSGEWGVLKVSAVSWGEFRPEENKRLPTSLNPRPEIEVRPQDVIVSRANTPDLVGRAVLVRASPPRLLLSDKLLRLRPRSGIVLPSYLNLVLGSSPSRLQIEDSATGSSKSMKNVSQDALRTIIIPIPPIEEQQRITAAIDSVSKRAEEEEASLVGLSALKAALMSVLLAGELRVHPDDEATS
jgi:type I restriction enzyme, S subunit